MTKREYKSMTEQQVRGRKARLLRDVRRRDGLGALTGTIVTIKSKYAGYEIRVPNPYERGTFNVSRVGPEYLELLPLEEGA